ncbi:Gibberellin receptor gid1b [Sarracenia purpurea var. burkii]
MAGSNEINVNESKKVVPLNTWILISQFKLAYNILRRPDGTFDRDLAEYLDRKVAPTRFLSTESTLSTS